MIQNRVLKFDNFLIGETFERLDIDNPEEAQIWADHDLAILVENRCGVIEVRMAGGISRDDIGETDAYYPQNPSWDLKLEQIPTLLGQSIG